MRVRRDSSLDILLRKCRGTKQSIHFKELVSAITCAFLCSLFLALPVFGDGVEMDEKAQKRPAARVASGAATSSGPGKSQEDSTLKEKGTGNETDAIEEKGPKLSDFDLARYQYCGEDSDCVVELNGCCECETGTQEVAINKNRVEAFRAQFVGCAEVSCGPVTASEHCGGGVVSCIEHRCKFFPSDEGI